MRITGCSIHFIEPDHNKVSESDRKHIEGVRKAIESLNEWQITGLMIAIETLSQNPDTREEANELFKSLLAKISDEGFNLDQKRKERVAANIQG